MFGLRRSVLSKVDEGQYSAWSVYDGNNRVYESVQRMQYQDAIDFIRNAQNDGYAVQQHNGTVYVSKGGVCRD